MSYLLKKLREKVQNWHRNQLIKEDNDVLRKCLNSAGQLDVFGAKEADFTKLRDLLTVFIERSWQSESQLKAVVKKILKNGVPANQAVQNELYEILEYLGYLPELKRHYLLCQVTKKHKMGTKPDGEPIWEEQTSWIRFFVNIRGNVEGVVGMMFPSRQAVVEWGKSNGLKMKSNPDKVKVEAETGIPVDKIRIPNKEEEFVIN